MPVYCVVHSVYPGLASLAQHLTSVPALQAFVEISFQYNNTMHYNIKNL